MNEARRRAVVTGAMLGTYQAHAIVGGLLAVVMFATGHDLLALLFGVGSAIGWAGWKRDFGLRIRFADPDYREEWKP